MDKIKKSHKPIQTGATYKGNLITAKEIEFKQPETEAELNELLRDEFTKYFQDGYSYQVQYYYDKLGQYRSAGFFHGSDNIRLPDMEGNYEDLELYSDISAMRILRVKTPDIILNQGNSKHNDCVYEALQKASVRNLPKQPATLKKWVNVGRKDKINVNSFEVIEDKLKCNINIVGDIVKQSTKQYTQEVVLNVKDGHTTYKANKTFTNLYTVNHKNKPLATYKTKDKTTVTCYDGKKYFELSYSDVKFYKSDYILMKADDLKQEFDEYTKNIKVVEKALNVSFQKAGYKVKNVARNLFYARNKNLPVGDTVDNIEYQWIDKCSNHGLMYVKPTEKRKTMKCYDVNSMYPYLMMSCQVPIYKPTYKTLTQEEFDDLQYYSFGIYRCKIDIKNKRLMTYNKHNHYTHFDIKRAKELGYTMTMVEDGKPNVALYVNRLSGSQIFKPYIEEIYQHKHTNKLFKKLLNILWGSLCEKTSKTTTIKNKTIEIDNLDDVIHIEPNRYIKTYDESKFKYSYGRMLSFLPAMGRYMISTEIESFNKQVKRIHTDGFYCSKTVDIETSKEMGKFKLEFEGKCQIHGLNNIEK